MSGEDDFLKRWSRRKREAAEVAKVDTPDAAKAVPENDVASGKSSDEPQAEFDLATLPPIESITAVSDVTAFLRAGVPPDLTRAALRRVWMADPAIRDFVGLAEYAWDFTDPNAMPGFGPLESTEEVRRMIAKIVDSIGKVAEQSAGEASSKKLEVGKNSNDSNVINATGQENEAPVVTDAPDQIAESPADILGNQVLLQSNKDDVAVQPDATEETEKSKQFSQRVHGRALPQ